MQFSNVLFLCIAFLALYLSLIAFLQFSFQYGNGFNRLFLLFLPFGILSSAALITALVKYSAFSVTDLESVTESGVTS